MSTPSVCSMMDLKWTLPGLNDSKNTIMVGSKRQASTFEIILFVLAWLHLLTAGDHKHHLKLFCVSAADTRFFVPLAVLISLTSIHGLYMAPPTKTWVTTATTPRTSTSYVFFLRKTLLWSYNCIPEYLQHSQRVKEAISWTLPPRW